MHLRYGTSLLSTQWPFRNCIVTFRKKELNMATANRVHSFIYYKVSKNDNEKSGFLNLFGFTQNLMKFEKIGNEFRIKLGRSYI